MTPKFKHDKFLGHYHGYDIYIKDGYIKARWGDRQDQQISCLIENLFSQFYDRATVKHMIKKDQFHLVAMLMGLANEKV